MTEQEEELLLTAAIRLVSRQEFRDAKLGVDEYLQIVGLDDYNSHEVAEIPAQSITDEKTEVEELVRRQDVEQLFKPEQHARRLEDLSRRLQAAASNPFDKEEVLTVAKELSDLSDKKAELLEEVQNQ